MILCSYSAWKSLRALGGPSTCQNGSLCLVAGGWWLMVEKQQTYAPFNGPHPSPGYSLAGAEGEGEIGDSRRTAPDADL
jgi:hypothetical protein